MNKQPKPNSHEVTSCGGDVLHFPGGNRKRPFFLPHDTPQAPKAQAEGVRCYQCGATMPDDAYARMYGRCARHADEESLTSEEE